MNNSPFSYPKEKHVRRHGPAGYVDYQRYRPWLRDEFIFRCVYCLKRERWGTVRGTYSLDHFLPQAHHRELSLEYGNLIYACHTCNSAKRDLLIPDPCDCMLEGQVLVHEDGNIQATTQDAEKLIRLLGLDSPEYCEFRRLWIDIIALAGRKKPDLFKRLMQYPDNLPDLQRLRPPKNTRPQGIHNSYLARREKGVLPETY